MIRLDVTERYSNSLLPKSVGQVSAACLGASIPPPPQPQNPKHFCLDKETVSCTFRRGMRMVAPPDSNVMSLTVPGEIGSVYITEINFGTLSPPDFERT